jgi:hypothetical protein
VTTTITKPLLPAIAKPHRDKQGVSFTDGTPLFSPFRLVMSGFFRTFAKRIST